MKGNSTSERQASRQSLRLSTEAEGAAGLASIFAQARSLTWTMEMPVLPPRHLLGLVTKMSAFTSSG